MTYYIYACIYLDAIPLWARTNVRTISLMATVIMIMVVNYLIFEYIPKKYDID